MNNDKYLTVSQITRYLKYKFDNDENLNTVFLKGEISNFKNHTTGHLYFTIKDENSRILAIMFRNNALKLKFKPTDGSKVLVVGKISVYEATGNYQIYVTDMQEDGVGNLYLEFEKLKKKLQEKGYFAKEHKKPIPKFPKKIGVITASTGAAIKDIITTINRRYRLAEVYLFPSLVQGENAKEDIVKKLKQADSFGCDVIILGRGGGSIEDLWPFNEEIVAEAIYNAKTPIISAVGHEIDFTISDFVADLRAPTPTAGAELAVPNSLELKQYIKQLELRLIKNATYIIEAKKKKLDYLTSRPILKNPMDIYVIKQQKLDMLLEKALYLIKEKTNLANNQVAILQNNLVVNIDKQLKNKERIFERVLTKLETLNPISTIKRGYSITRKEGKVITELKNVKKEDVIKTEVQDGYITSKVLEVEGK